MSFLLGFFVGVASGLVANYMSPPLKRLVERGLGHLAHFINPDRFDLTGTWEQVFTEPSPNGTDWEEVRETVVLQHLGTVVTGRGITQDDHREFAYDLEVRHNTVSGSYEKGGALGNITGRGVNELPRGKPRSMVFCSSPSFRA